MPHSFSRLLLLSSTSFFLLIILACWSEKCRAQVSAKTNGSIITVDDIYTKRLFQPKTIGEMYSLKDGKSFCRLDAASSSVVRYSYETGKSLDTLLKQSQLNGVELKNYAFSADENLVLVSTKVEQIYRRSSKAVNYIFSRKTGKIELLAEGTQQAVTFSPAGGRVCWVSNNNLFVKDLGTRKIIQLTDDGEKNSIINGICDWVYEEEFQFSKAFFWSPDGNKVAYYRFDEKQVPLVSIPFYEGLYPRQYVYKYPKAGEPNSKVEVHIVNADGGKNIKAAIGTPEYIPRVSWTTTSSKLCVSTLNRRQDTLDFLLVESSSGKSTHMLRATDKAYVELKENDGIHFLNDGKHFILSSDKDGFRNLYLYDLNGKQVRNLTPAPFDVTEFYGENLGTVYYQAAYPLPINRSVMQANVSGGEPKVISSTGGTASAQFNSAFTYFVGTNSTAATPPVYSVCSSDGKLIRTLENNQQLQMRSDAFRFIPLTFLKIPLSSELYVNAYMVKPPGFDSSKKHPVLMFVYGGPGHQEVLNGWKANNPWHQLLASIGYLIVCVDGRGTGGRGAAFQKSTYKRLGELELADQLGAGRWIARQTWADPSRIGIWGWSFGGYLSSLCAVRGSDVFKMAIAVAPVTSWRFYDSIYTERFLQTPFENGAGYDDNSPITYASGLRAKFLLVHGTADDNVHFQNSVMFSEALIAAGKSFEQAYYPNKNHGINSGNTSNHLFTRLTNFVLANL